MELTVGYLKKVLEQLDDNIIIADLGRGNNDFDPYLSIKRLLVLKDESERKEWGGKTFLSINKMGSHYTGKGEQSPLKFTGIHFDEYSFVENCKCKNGATGRTVTADFEHRICETCGKIVK